MSDEAENQDPFEARVTYVSQGRGRGNLGLTQALIDEAVRFAELGNFRMSIRAMLRVPATTWSQWLSTGRKELEEWGKSEEEKDLPLRAQLVSRLEEAEERAHMRIMRDVAQSEDDRVKLEFLKRRYNKRYSNNPNIKLDEETGQKTEVTGRELLAERLTAFFAARDAAAADDMND